MKITINYKSQLKIFYFILIFSCVLGLSLFKNAKAQSTVTPSTSVTASPTVSISPTVSATPTEAPTPTSSPEVTSVEQKEFSGTITKKEGNTFTINTSDGPKRVTVTDNVRVTKNGVVAKVEQVKVNDKVTFAQTPSGELLSLAVTSSEVSEFSKRALPALLIGLLLLALIIYFVRKGRGGTIKTTPEKVN